MNLNIAVHVSSFEEWKNVVSWALNMNINWCYVTKCFDEYRSELYNKYKSDSVLFIENNELSFENVSWGAFREMTDGLKMMDYPIFVSRLPAIKPR